MRISTESLNTLFIYTIFLFIGLNIKLFNGFYIYNILIILFLFLHHDKLKISKNTLYNISFVSFVMLMCIFIQIYYIETFSMTNFYIFLNLILLLTFILFIKEIKFENINYNIFIVLLSLPIVFSLLMFHNQNIETILLSFYGMEKYPAFGRYGGVFGKDVNALGIAASILFFLTMILRYKKSISLVVALVIVFLSLYAIVLSGMRTGILVIFTALIIFHFKIKILNFNYIFLSIGGLFLLVLSIYNLNDNIKNLVDYILSRFSIDSFMKGFNDNDDGDNLKVAIAYFYDTIKNEVFDAKAILFGINSSLNYVDNFYVFSFIKYGLVFVGISIVVLFMILKRAFVQNDYIFLLLFLISITLALKGLFVLNDYYMFIVIFILYFWRNYENPNRI